MDEKCKQYNLRACVDIPSYWGVKDDGTIDFTNPCGEGDADTDNFDAYYCEGCGDTWICLHCHRKATTSDFIAWME